MELHSGDSLIMTQNGKGFPDYTNPPLYEVVCGLKFEPLNLKVPYYGLFWRDALKSEFPTCEHAPPLGLLPDSIRPENLPLPRVWFVNKSDDHVLQLQDDGFLFNWRRGSHDSSYPRFAAVFDSFQSYLKLFKDFLYKYELGQMKQKRYELTYINHILEGEGWGGLGDIGNVMADLRWDSDKKQALPDPSNLNLTYAFPMSNDKGTIYASLKYGQRISDERNLLKLELNAFSNPSCVDEDDLVAWFQLAHESVVYGFSDLTEPKMRKDVWGEHD